MNFYEAEQEALRRWGPTAFVARGVNCQVGYYADPRRTPETSGPPWPVMAWHGPTFEDAFAAVDGVAIRSSGEANVS
jgi:hypothetical protein